MKKLMTAAFALSALFAVSAKVHAEVNYPWCIIGDTRAVDCYISSREQCMQDGRNRGFGGQCIQNPFYKPGKPTVSGEKPTVSQTARPLQAVSAPQSTCSGLKAACLSSLGASKRCLGLGGSGDFWGYGPYCENLCNFTWEHCMKTGWWNGRTAERR
jgi:Protein of unknown function (DUF3551)